MFWKPLVTQVYNTSIQVTTHPRFDDNLFVILVEQIIMMM